jgi:hypothetical protein
MQALSDEQQMDRLEKKVDEVRAQVLSSERGLRSEIIAARSDARADFRTLLAVVLAMWTSTVLAVVAVLLGRL